MQGSVHAAKELREWLRAKRERDQTVESIDSATTYAQLTHAQRLELRARLLGQYLAEDKLLAPWGEGRRCTCLQGESAGELEEWPVPPARWPVGQSE